MSNFTNDEIRKMFEKIESQMLIQGSVDKYLMGFVDGVSCLLDIGDERRDRLEKEARERKEANK